VDFQDGRLICLAPDQVIILEDCVLKIQAELQENIDHTVVAQVKNVLKAYFKEQRDGLPTVKYLAAQVNLSPGYLGNLLKKETGKNAQDHIHFYLIEEAKSTLLNTNKSIGEIAFSLGFEYPQYFTKLFKQKTGQTPLAFRSSPL
jgi:YesN/AraC family two-component response regulator